MSVYNQDWRYEDYFRNIESFSLDNEMISEAKNLIDKSNIQNHPFFKFAKENKMAILEWTKQECVITNFFSMALFHCFSKIKNVNIRSILLPVIDGEHSQISSGVAKGAHPNLLAKLVHDLGISSDSIIPSDPTIKFAEILFGVDKSVPFQIGVIGIGNESLLVPEYEAVSNCFSMHYQRSIYRPFLKSNIEEDKSHSKLMEIAAQYLCQTSNEKKEFIDGAKFGIESRIKYYDDLLLTITKKI